MRIAKVFLFSFVLNFTMPVHAVKLRISKIELASLRRSCVQLAKYETGAGISSLHQASPARPIHVITKSGSVCVCRLSQNEIYEHQCY